ncbi:autotransporter outer membrane beta-barrel domain-containing protein [Pseudomonas sp. PSKL.D1]|uniref:autotransporter outer membrane beta-barrel domain-containing protein n=1 Tax=Pseudomonas sp. PSKL.D1 TaxID=3029060 RepID=UPI002380EAA6|nr:autotransporter outer membrane beta-barrel domain-containing protein [Pseudomonas sp. PSKL.D1]WDY57218.1 autotransporter outer membrane beta-barrel domain-containing protein [Pseudomonas sp. PSKL.D1]
MSVDRKRASTLFFPALFISLCAPANAADVPPGSSVTIRPGDAAERWTLDAANLTIVPGGQSLTILANPGSTITLDGATVSGGNLRAVVLTESQGTIRGSTITSTNNTGLSVVRGVDESIPGSTVRVENTTITAAGRGLNVAGGSSATVIDSTITGTGAVGGSVAGSGLGVTLVGGEAILQNTTAIGSNWAAGLFTNTPGSADPRLVLDGSTLESQTGSTIVVSNLSTEQMLATVEVRGGSTLKSANGTLLEVGLPGDPANRVAQAQLTVDASKLTGDVQVATGAVADVLMSNGASLTGTLNNVRNLTLDASSISGNVNEPEGSTSTATLLAGSTLSGNVLNIGTLRLDASSMSGNVTSVPGSTTSVALNNGSILAGSVINARSLALNNSQMTGDLTLDANSASTLSLANGSRLIGTVSNVGTTAIETGSTFDMLNNSQVGALRLDGGTVNLGGGNGTFRTLTASGLEGNGAFVLGTDLALGQSDLVNIEGLAQGSHTLAIVNTGVEPAGDVAQRVVHTEGGSASFALQSASGLVDIGTFSYELQQRDTDWYLVQDSTPIISPGTQTAIAVFSAAPTVWYGELSTLRSRMGELRNGQGQGGFWARTYGNKYRVSAADQVHYEQTQQGVSLGVDTPLPSQSGTWLVGLMGGYSNSQLNMRLGSDGEVNSYYVGLYSTWLGDNGYYLDATLKANRFDNKADVRMSDGEKSAGDYNNHGVGGTLEAGRHIKLNAGWFVEPYMQLSALWVEGEHYEMDNGLQADSNRANSLLGKVGTHVGRTLPLQQGGFVQPYVKLAVAREFARNNDIKVNNTTFHDDLSGSRGEIGAGIAAQLTDVLQLHADVDYSNGKNIEQPWGVNVGVRVVW